MVASAACCRASMLGQPAPKRRPGAQRQCVRTHAYDPRAGPGVAPWLVGIEEEVDAALRPWHAAVRLLEISRPACASGEPREEIVEAHQVLQALSRHSALPLSDRSVISHQHDPPERVIFSRA